jgi:hypothetical protein|tara:strand:- start:1055 stop:1534 length:480 start_codon:yes stop_codon:yes gene_type:complete
MPEENTLKVVEATATNAIELPDGRRIDALVQVPTTENDYGGDDAAAMLADVIARRSTKVSEADAAFESALSQLDQNWDDVRYKVRADKYKATRPMMNMWMEYDNAGVLIKIHILTVHGYAPWDPNLKPQMNTLTVDEMDRVILEKEYGISSVIDPVEVH